MRHVAWRHYTPLYPLTPEDRKQYATQRYDTVSPAGADRWPWRDAPNGDVIAVTNPANGEQLGSVPKMGADETREAIEAANRALPAGAPDRQERANILRRWFDLMMENQDDLARLMTSSRKTAGGSQRRNQLRRLLY